MTSHKAGDPLEGPLGLVLSGGGARGAFQVGVWEVLRTHDEFNTPLVISGSSAGSINGYLIAHGLSPSELLEFWLGLAKDPPVRANRGLIAQLLDYRALLDLVGGSLRQLLHQKRLPSPVNVIAESLELFVTHHIDDMTQALEHTDSAHLFDTGALTRHLERATQGRKVSQDIKLAINAVDVQSGGVVRYVTGSTRHHANSNQQSYVPCKVISLDMIAASSAIPLLFNQVQVGPRHLWDGGVLVNTPIAPAVALGASRILPVLVSPKPAAHGTSFDSSLGHAVERLADTVLENAYNADRKLLLVRNRLIELEKELLAAERHPAPSGLEQVHLYEPIRPPEAGFDAGSYLCFEAQALRRMYEAGKEAAQSWLAGKPQRDALC